MDFFPKVFFVCLNYDLRLHWDTMLIAAAFHIYMYIPKGNRRYRRWHHTLVFNEHFLIFIFSCSVLSLSSLYNPPASPYVILHSFKKTWPRISISTTHILSLSSDRSGTNGIAPDPPSLLIPKNIFPLAHHPHPVQMLMLPLHRKELPICA